LYHFPISSFSGINTPPMVTFKVPIQWHGILALEEMNPVFPTHQ
jgi:hypothetical protein